MFVYVLFTFQSMNTGKDVEREETKRGPRMSLKEGNTRSKETKESNVHRVVRVVWVEINPCKTEIRL